MANIFSNHVFLSYSRKDETKVRAIYDNFIDERLPSWIDREHIDPGQEWAVRVEKAIYQAHLVLIFLSNHSVAADGYFQKEILLAQECWKEKSPGKTYIIPVRLEDCPIHERLKQFQCIDVFQKDGWSKLLNKVKAALSPQIDNSSQRATNMTPTIETAIESMQTLCRAIPLVTFPSEVRRFVEDSITTNGWVGLSEQTKRIILTLGCKLEAIVQIVPPTPAPLVHGFECLALGEQGENFPTICSRCLDLDPALIRICLAIVAIKTASSLRQEALKKGHKGACNLLFTINLDPIMIESPHFKKFLSWYGLELKHNVIFEVNESTTKQYLSILKNLKTDFGLRYAADDLNHWQQDVRAGLIKHVEITKMDHSSFVKAMEGRGDNAKQTMRALLAHNIKNKALIVEGVQDPDYIDFLERHWDFKKHGFLYGQGYILDSGIHWDSAVKPLKGYGLPGGSFLLVEPTLIMNRPEQPSMRPMV
jgi:EAL domain-containing protein (putative c-di-GMP-specific phosphodiesterase class I)